MENSKKEDIQELQKVKEVLIEVSKNVYRNIEFFYKSEDKKRRRKIYNIQLDYDSDDSYGIVCNTLCKIVKEICVNKYGLNIELVSCDSDEFGHVDILLHTKNGNKYIINCLSDLERLQLGMKSKRFASEKYFDERYSKLFDKSEFSFLTEEDNKKIDENIGYYKSMYMDEFFDMIKSEFDEIKNLLKNDDSLRKTLLGDKSQIEDVENLTKEQLTNLKLKFLLDFCNKRSGIIGHIELIRIYKILSKKLFSEDEIKNIKSSDCFFDKKENEFKDEIWNVNEERIRFLKLQIEEDIYILTTTNNTYLHMKKDEYEIFKKENDIYEKSISGSVYEILENIKNKGIGINILMHPIVKNMIIRLDEISKEIPSEKLSKIIEQIKNANPNNINFELQGQNIFISISEEHILIGINNEITKYFLKNDELIMEKDGNIYTYQFIDEGKYNIVQNKEQR